MPTIGVTVPALVDNVVGAVAGAEEDTGAAALVRGTTPPAELVGPAIAVLAKSLNSCKYRSTQGSIQYSQSSMGFLSKVAHS